VQAATTLLTVDDPAGGYGLVYTGGSGISPRRSVRGNDHLARGPGGDHGVGGELGQLVRIWATARRFRTSR